MPANTIDIMQSYPGMLDEAYKQASLTSCLDTDGISVLPGLTSTEIVVPLMTLQGLANYSKDTGYANGSVSLTNVTMWCNFDRGRMFQIDVMDDQSTAGLAFGKLAGEFIRTQVVPELDAFRFARYATEKTTQAIKETITTGEQALKAIRKAISELDKFEVPMNDRYLFITSDLLGLIEDLPTTTSRAALDNFEKITRVNPSVFYSSITQRDGVSDSGLVGGFFKAVGAASLNFMVVHKRAVLQYAFHVQPKIISPSENQTADAWKFGYRMVAISKLMEAKKTGVYVNQLP